MSDANEIFFRELSTPSLASRLQNIAGRSTLTHEDKFAVLEAARRLDQAYIDRKIDK